MRLDRHLSNHGHIHRFVVTEDRSGWEVREEEDSTVLRRVHRGDWHLVEMEKQIFEIRAVALKRDGWTEN